MTKLAHEDPSRFPPSVRRAALVGLRVTPVAAAAALACALASAPCPAEAREAVAHQVSLSQIANGRGGFGIEGIAGGDLTGYDVSSAGDVNGDGLDDLIIGAPASDSKGHSSGGRAFVVFGRTDTSRVRLEDVAAGVGGFVLNGMTTSASAGASVAGAGDVNGDGLADVIVLAQRYCCAQTATAYVVFGKASTSPVDLDASLASKKHGFVISGLGDMDGVGQVAGVGDVNGDGLADLMLETSSTHGSNHGAAYVVFGKADSKEVSVGDLGKGGFVIRPSGHIGTRLSGAGDVNGDGLADLVLGEVYGDFHIYDSFAWVVFGKKDTAPVDLSAVEKGRGGFVMIGAGSGYYLDGAGASVAGVGDVNGDGFADVLVGAYEASRGGGGYVVFGKTDTSPVHLADVRAGHGGFGIFGEPGTTAGWSAAPAGDINGDGLADFLLSDQGHGAPRRSYVIFGKTDSAIVSLTSVAEGRGGIAINGELASPEYAYNSVSAAGDVNGDGLADLVVGDRYAGPTGAGRAYVIFGATTGAFSASEVDQLGGDGDDTLTGTPHSDVLVGGRGNDSLVGKAGADVLQGGSGDDVIVVNASNITALSAPFGVGGNGHHLSRVDGGSGVDTLRLNGAGITMDLSRIASQGASLPGSVSRIESIERIDLTGSGDNTLSFGVGDVQDIVGMNWLNSRTQDALGWSNGTYAFPLTVRRHQLVVDGNAGDTVNLPAAASSWIDAGTVSHAGIGYTVYYTGGPQFERVEVIIANAITVNPPGAAGLPGAR